MEDDDINISELAMYLDESHDDEVLSGVQESDRFISLDDWLEIDDIEYRKY